MSSSSPAPGSLGAPLDALHQLWHQVHSDQGISFPHAVAGLLGLGVSRYHVDYVACTVTSYISGASTLPTVDVSPIPSYGTVVPGTRSAFNAGAVVDAIRRTSRGETTYREFSAECIEAGVVGYMAYLNGKRVMYLGSEGDFHVEWFPGAGPKQD